MAALRFLYYFGGALAILVLVLLGIALAYYVLTHRPIVVRQVVYVNRTVPVPVYVNRTVVETVVKYINQTVPIYVNRTVYVYVPTYIYENPLPQYYGYCSGRLVVLPNGTGWLVMFMLVNPRQYAQAWRESLGTLYTNATTHYAEFGALLEPAVIVLPTANYTVLGLSGLVCNTMNYTINGYWPTVCGDVGGGGPITLRGSGVGVGVTNQTVEFTFLTPAGAVNESLGLNRTYLAILLTSPVALSHGSWIPAESMFMPCQLAVTYAPNPTAALWLPVTPNATLIDYWHEAAVEVDGYYDPYDWTMGFWVWLTPS